MTTEAPTGHGLTSASWETEDIDVDAYLRRLGVERDAPTLELLARIHAAHVRVFPFSNVDVLLRQHPGVAPAAIMDKLVRRGRGGYCFEHAQLMAAALQGLGYPVTRRLGRVHAPENGRTHLTLHVDVDGTTYLADPGFGLSITGPLEVADGAERREWTGVFDLRRHLIDGVEHWELRRNGELQHLTDVLRVVPKDVRSAHLTTSTDPDGSTFLRRLVVSRFTGEGHVTVIDGARTLRRPGRDTVREELSPRETIQAVRDLDVELSGEDAARLEVILAHWQVADLRTERRTSAHLIATN
ncbi:arylamine N-acetyltransferase [Tersicoccus solisilvae]|uniref:Arylamine N-acetyltransferase n=1 Tax=Tersicoccus solisilvae TaxID=1882339 RepID=A0ABQ1P529_9MICC|nr:arylamine N-acetyltransferase [Tersicoccus solisilvae]GGC91284.1 arylamine N-acetyltransferase [Tersicoccus solisilvae]